MSLFQTYRAYRAGESGIVPVFVAQSVVAGVLEFLRGCVPNEGIVKIFGFDCTHEGRRFAKVTDWFAGEQKVTAVTATFTDAGLREVELARQKKYPARDSRPIELGIAHSHPFGHNPEFSGTDRDTFCHFPYGPDNVHFLIDPTADFFKVYITHREGPGQPVELVQVPWAYFS